MVCLNGWLNTVAEIAKGIADDKNRVAPSDAPVYEGGNFADTVVSESLIRIEEQRKHEKDSLVKNRILKIGVMGIAGLVIFNSLQ